MLVRVQNAGDGRRALPLTPPATPTPGGPHVVEPARRDPEVRAPRRRPVRRRPGPAFELDARLRPPRRAPDRVPHRGLARRGGRARGTRRAVGLRPGLLGRVARHPVRGPPAAGGRRDRLGGAGVGPGRRGVRLERTGALPDGPRGVAGALDPPRPRRRPPGGPPPRDEPPRGTRPRPPPRPPPP